MPYRDDNEALRARLAALDQELEWERVRRRETEERIEAERRRHLKEVRAVRLEGRAGLPWAPVVVLAAGGVLAGVEAAFVYDWAGQLRGAAPASLDVARLAERHGAAVLHWAASVAVVATCAAAVASVLLRRARVSAWLTATAVLLVALSALTGHRGWGFSDWSTHAVRLTLSVGLACSILRLRRPTVTLEEAPEHPAPAAPAAEAPAAEAPATAAPADEETFF